MRREGYCTLFIKIPDVRAPDLVVKQAENGLILVDV